MGVNAGKLRALQTFVQDNPSQLDLTTFGEESDWRGTVADLAGWTLMLNGWELVADGTFRRTADGREVHGWEAIEREARAILGLDEEDEWDRSDVEPLFSILDLETALKRLQELVDAAEAVKAGA